MPLLPRLRAHHAACLVLLTAACALNRDPDDVSLRDSGNPEPSGDAGDDTAVADMASGGADAALDWWDEAYTKRVRIQANHDRTARAENIPIALHLSNHVDVDAEPRELRFVGPEGKIFEHEVVEWDTRKTVWVRLPVLAERSELWLYWGNSESLDISDTDAVWSDGFEFVGHLDKEMPADALDTTRFAQATGDPTFTDGIVGGGFDFDGDDRLGFGSKESDGIGPGTTYTWEVWFLPREAQDGTILNNEGWCSGFHIGFDDGELEAELASGGTGVREEWCTTGYRRQPAVGPAPSLNEWHYAVAWVDRNERTVTSWVDGALLATGEIVEDANGLGSGLTIGNSHSGTLGFVGLIDEARISSVLRSEDWVTFQNLATRDQLFVYGEVETLD